MVDKRCKNKYVIMFFVTANGKNWSDYNDPTFEPVFFNANLTALFPEKAKRDKAIGLCNGGAATDDNPEARRECYFDFLVSIFSAYCIHINRAELINGICSQCWELPSSSNDKCIKLMYHLIEWVRQFPSTAKQSGLKW